MAALEAAVHMMLCMEEEACQRCPERVAPVTRMPSMLEEQKVEEEHSPSEESPSEEAAWTGVANPSRNKGISTNAEQLSVDDKFELLWHQESRTS